MEVVDCCHVFDRFETKFVGRSVAETLADSGTRHPACEARWIVVLTEYLGLEHRHPSGFCCEAAKSHPPFLRCVVPNQKPFSLTDHVAGTSTMVRLGFRWGPERKPTFRFPAEAVRKDE